MTSNVIHWLEIKFPNHLPIKKVSEYELGILVGQQQVIEDLKVKLKIEEDSYNGFEPKEEMEEK